MHPSECRTERRSGGREKHTWRTRGEERRGEAHMENQERAEEQEGM